MKLNDFKIMDTKSGVQAVLDFGKYQLSVVSNDFSYGGKQGLYEIAVFAEGDMIELPGITNEGDTVKGWLTESDVDTIIKKMYAITGKEPEQV